jgi:hypothetical protein
LFDRQSCFERTYFVPILEGARNLSQEKFSILLRAIVGRHTGEMKGRAKVPEIAEVVRLWLPDADDEELKEATINLRRYLAAIYRIVLRLEADGKLSPVRDKLRADATVVSHIPNDA